MNKRVSSTKPRKRTAARRRELQAVLDAIREHQPLSRADLARVLQVNRGIITSLVNDLLTDEAIVEGRTVDAPRGRRPTMLFIRKHDPLVVAVDVRFNTTQLLLGELSGKEIAREAFATPRRPVALINRIAKTVEHLARTHIADGAVRSIGVLLPGVVDPQSGRLLNAPQLGWHDVDLRTALSEATGLPVCIDNAAAGCAQLHRHRDFVYLLVSDTVTASIVSNGQIVRGANFAAGEFGHLPVDRRGPRCNCGARGCLQSCVSNEATLARYPHNDVTIEELIARARGGDEHARKAIARTARYLGIGIAAIVNAINPAQIIVAGEVTDVWGMIEGPIRAVLRRRALTPATAATPIRRDPTPHPRLRAAATLAATSVPRTSRPHR